MVIKTRADGALLLYILLLNIEIIFSLSLFHDVCIALLIAFSILNSFTSFSSASIEYIFSLKFFAYIGCSTNNSIDFFMYLYPIKS